MTQETHFTDTASGKFRERQGRPAFMQTLELFLSKSPATKAILEFRVGIIGLDRIFPSWLRVSSSHVERDLNTVLRHMIFTEKPLIFFFLN